MYVYRIFSKDKRERRGNNVSHKGRTKPVITFFYIVLIAVLLTLIIYFPFIKAWFTKGYVFSGLGDGFRQMMPFQMYLYEHYTQYRGFYNHSFGLGGDYVKGLAYYYSLSPIMWLNFLFIWLGEMLFNLNPHTIDFWPFNQLLVAIFRTILTIISAYYFFKYIISKPVALWIATISYSASTVVIYFNFTWSFYGDLLILLPLSLWGMERFFKHGKIGLFIIAVALTLFSNFYFSYYQAIVLGIYFLYRLIKQHLNDIATRWQKFYVLVISAMLSLSASIFGFYTGVSSFLNNDRKQNTDFNISLFTDLTQSKYHIFSDGFYVTISIIILIALFSFKLYKYYYYKMFAILTWFLLIGSLSQYFDSAFNGFSLPQRRWVYFLVLTSSALIALFIQHLTELSIRQYLIVAIPVFLFGLIRYISADKYVGWMLVAFILIIILGVLIYKAHWMTHKWILIGLTLLFLVQQLALIHNSKERSIDPYAVTRDHVTTPKYFNKKLNHAIKDIQSSSKDPLNRIDYMSNYGLNSPFIYHYNGISLYSSIFDGDILDYYDNTMQINMPIDKNSTYRLLNNRANLMALWNVQDRFKHSEDKNMPYGFKEQNRIHYKNDELIHSTNEISYPSSHITSKVYDSDDLKSPLDREQTMLDGIVSTKDNNLKVNQSFKANKNLLNEAKVTTHNASYINSNQLQVNKNNGGLKIQLPKSQVNRFKDMYVEMDIELLAPDKDHYVGMNEYKQKRNKLTYKYRRFVTPVTMRVKASDELNLRMSKGKYRVNIKGIYGEDYQHLKSASEKLKPVKVKENRNGYTIHKDKNDSGYVILPIAYAEGMKATINNKPAKVMKANGIMTAIPTKKGQTEIRLTYTPQHFYLLIIISIIGVISSLGFTWWVKRKFKRES